MRIKKLFILISLLTTAKLFANYPVFDQLGWLAAIDRFYQGYDQVMNTLTMIEQNYNQMQKAYERAKSWNFENLDFNDGDILHSIDIRDELRQAGTQINRQLTNVRQIKEAFTAKNIVMNGHTYSLKDLAGVGDADRSILDLTSDAYYANKDSVLSAARAFASGVSADEAERVYAKYGLSPKNFAMVKSVDQMMQKAAMAVLAPAQDLLEGAYSNQDKEKIELTNTIMKKILETDTDSLTTNEILQVQALLQRESINEMRELVRSFRTASAYSAWKDRYVKAEAEAKEDEPRKLTLIKEHENKYMQDIF